jgi:hypothetical protein
MSDPDSRREPSPTTRDERVRAAASWAAAVSALAVKDAQSIRNGSSR